ncbi:conserved hypothetical protein [Culex quinquefasciatus]|uniref:FLYWCH-type domain-containing protein n=1 Tax=Culex quinquefasciatus TaxID=7176 RepID=B0W3A1_CULQU|nr:conserved hypothetical protein [Culex quinquefasciatus]|eukprot:XP_001843185.1 conserved hypothetical protein [Culex quinquefasciatus]
METVPTIQFSKTQRGRIMLIYEGYKYVENRQSNKNVFWRCSKYVKFGCRATCVTSKNPNDFPIRLAGSAHSHGPEKIYPSDKVIVPTDQEIQALTNLRPEYCVASFGFTQRGYIMLLHDGYGFTKDRQTAKGSNWKCSLFRRMKCRARAITRTINGADMMKITQPYHTHGRDEYRVEM